MKLVKALADNHAGRFIVFADSRKIVEQIVAIAGRGATSNLEDEDEEIVEDLPDAIEQMPSILPCRSGYEEDDRAAIQDALANGTLAGVVSTSALEIGLDIGDLDIVILLRTPNSVKSFLQRIGRAGRKSTGYVLIVNDTASPTGGLSLETMLEKEPECGWLYLGNIYIQYTHALCAVQEISESGTAPYNKTIFSTVPSPFIRMVENEINPVEAIPQELYPLKQRGKRKTVHLYGPDSLYSQKPLVRFFETTGVLWHTEDTSLAGETMNTAILSAFCAYNSIQENDLGLGSFFMRANAFWPNDCKGYCIYDTTPGSLHLSEQLYHDFLGILELAQSYVDEDIPDRISVFHSLGVLADVVQGFIPVDLTRLYDLGNIKSTDPDWLTVVQPNQRAIYRHTNGDEEVEILEYRYTPRGHLYRIDSKDKEETRLVPYEAIIPLPGQTELHEVNLMTGEYRPCQLPTQLQE